MKALFDQVSGLCCRLITAQYSTSFSIAVRCLAPQLREPIYAIYGFVRLADEITDSFHEFEQASLLRTFRREFEKSVAAKISLNPVLNAFQHVIHKYNIEQSLVDQFLVSMEMDLHSKSYDPAMLKKYIGGSAEAVGLMCLRVFVNGDDVMFEELRPGAMRLGAAFQKINFLRDIHADYAGLRRTYFQGCGADGIDELKKKDIEREISDDLRAGYQGIRALPRSSRFGVLVAYTYYRALFMKICQTPSTRIMTARVRINDSHKAGLLAWSYFRHRFNML